MKFPKPTRIKNKKVLEKARKLNCVACDAEPPSDPHHITSVGARGGDTKDNIISLCRQCHSTLHQIGMRSFQLKYFTVRLWLIDNKRLEYVSHENYRPGTSEKNESN